MVTASDETGTILQMIAAAAAMACTGPRPRRQALGFGALVLNLARQIVSPG
jgi:hypothetical protein